MNNDIRIGTSGGQDDLKLLVDKLENNHLGWETSVKHFSVGLRFFESFEVELGERALATGLSLAVHPVDINLSADLDNGELSTLKENLRNFPFIYLEEDLGLWRYKNIFLGAHQTDPGFSETSLHQAASNAAFVQDELGIPVIIENPPVYSGDIGMGFWAYYEQVCDSSGCQMAFDVGHYLGYCRVNSIPCRVPDKSCDIWKSIKTVHLSGMKYWKWNGAAVWLDQHADKYNDEMIRIAQSCINNVKDLHNILLEMEGANNIVRQQNFLLVKSLLQEPH
ncbi:DUF692 family protein [Pseudomonas phytophila]|uniref:DUF692 family protein n=1 Tax=Pseudomonas phytophila TaxID=2867264 RepID=A0ABY6FDF8_9PSED|nr:MULTISPECIES: DUF692 family multinuclear iron-containing protein [Pseudomonas]MCD5989424.1 DUF692 family protein [Pseudomonas quasicaspiana]UXZ95673.1 DUF692 family protein [Pseudomonas phytophila]